MRASSSASSSRCLLLLAGLAAGLLVACEDERGDFDTTPVAPTSATTAKTAAATVSSATAATPAAAELVTRAGSALGTEVTLRAFTDNAHDRAAVEASLAAAWTEIERLEAVLSEWRADSEISRINAAGTAGQVVGPETLAVIDKSLWISRASDGVFDITFASMGELWRFGKDDPPSVPTRAAVEAARGRIDYRKISVDHDERRIRLAAGTKIGVGGIAKGYIMDRAAAELRRRGLERFFVQAGGDLYVSGDKPDGSPWRVGIRDPRGPEDAVFAVAPIRDRAFSTAGDYQRAFVVDGRRYHHIIDPRTGYPATASRSVTIWARDAITADAIDDAVFILGPERGLALVESLPDCGAVIVAADNSVHVSRRLEGTVKVLRPPSQGP